MEREITVVGGGTAGLVAALTLMRRCPNTAVTVIRSSKLGVIGVGEGTFADTPNYLHEDLGIPRADFYEQVNPVLKLGVRLEWGPRPYFDYPFNELCDNQALPSPRKPWGYYHLDDYTQETVPPRISGQIPDKSVGYHVENKPFVEYLERFFVNLGGTLVDAQIASSETGERGVESVILESGERHTADLFVDATGFRAELINKALDEPFVSMSDHLFCNNAVVGGWRREDEPVKPYTTMETMDTGWCWQIEHENFINRGYVYCSDYISADDAAAEFTRKNPKINPDNVRTVPFPAQHVRRPWVKNVVAIGNACGFVEPLEATNIQVICMQARRMAHAINDGGLTNPGIVDTYNDAIRSEWEDIRDFLALHYRFNYRLDTPFWEMATRETPLGGLEEYVKQYQAVGPALLADEQGKPLSMFGYDGHLAVLLGLRVPWESNAIH